MFDYKSKRWMLLRNRVMRRDNFLCQESLRFGKRKPAKVVHHCYPVSQFPEFAYCEWNLISLTIEEHNSMHDRDTNELTDLGKRWMKVAERRKKSSTPPDLS